MKPCNTSHNGNVLWCPPDQVMQFYEHLFCLLVMVPAAGDPTDFVDRCRGAKEFPVIFVGAFDETDAFQAIIELQRKTGYAASVPYIGTKKLRPCLQPAQRRLTGCFSARQCGTPF
jgi:hypothetical protein